MIVTRLDVRLRRTPSPLRRLTGPLGRRIFEHRSELRKISASHGESNVRVFGSVTRGEETTDSDIDLLVAVAALTIAAA